MSGVAVYAILLALPEPQLAAHLAAWEKAAKDITNVRADFTLTRTEPVFKREATFTGSLLHLRPVSTSLRLVPATDQDDYEAYVSDGKRLYMSSGRDKTVTEFRLADPTAANPDDPEDTPVRLLLGRAFVEVASPGSNPVFAPLVGVPPTEFVKRYHVALVKQDANYLYLDIRPRTPADRQRFTQVRWALYGPNAPKPHSPYTPAQVYLGQPNGETEIWTFTAVKLNRPDVHPTAFQYEEVPGYKLRKAPEPKPPAPK